MGINDITKFIGKTFKGLFKESLGSYKLEEQRRKFLWAVFIIIFSIIIIIICFNGIRSEAISPLPHIDSFETSDNEDKEYSMLSVTEYTTIIFGHLRDNYPDITLYRVITSEINNKIDCYIKSNNLNKTYNQLSEIYYSTESLINNEDTKITLVIHLLASDTNDYAFCMNGIIHK